MYFNKRFSCWPIFSTISKVSNETDVYTWFSPSVVVLGAEKESKIIRPCQTKPFGSAWNDIHRGWTDDKAPPFRKSQCSKGMMFAMSLIILVCGKLFTYLIYVFYLQFCTWMSMFRSFVGSLRASLIPFQSKNWRRVKSWPTFLGFWSGNIQPRAQTHFQLEGLLSIGIVFFLTYSWWGSSQAKQPKLATHPAHLVAMITVGCCECNIGQELSVSMVCCFSSFRSKPTLYRYTLTFQMVLPKRRRWEIRDSPAFFDVPFVIKL